MILEDIYTQACNDTGAVEIRELGSVSYVNNGIKITKTDNGDIRIYLTFLGGEYYSEARPKEYRMFAQHGWDRAGRMILGYYYRDRIANANIRLQYAISTNNQQEDRKLRQLIANLTEKNNKINLV